MGAALNIAGAEGRQDRRDHGLCGPARTLHPLVGAALGRSIGKDGKGSQPVAAIGPVDQHSQMQLYLGGPNDKLFTVLTTGVAGTGP